jgi:hypothetical protein
MVRRAAFPSASSIAGVARVSLVCPASSAFAVDSNTTSAAALVAALIASPAIVLTPWAASTIASFALLVTVLTMQTSAETHSLMLVRLGGSKRVVKVQRELEGMHWHGAARAELAGATFGDAGGQSGSDSIRQ